MNKFIRLYFSQKRFRIIEWETQPWQRYTYIKVLDTFTNKSFTMRGGGCRAMIYVYHMYNFGHVMDKKRLRDMVFVEIIHQQIQEEERNKEDGLTTS